MLWFRQHFFSFTIVILLLLTAGVSYVRFMMLHDYVVAYEGDCDPYTQSCFIGCEDDECTEEYYYSAVQKYAPNVEAQCGPDITDCDAAYECLPEDGDQCEIVYCDPVIDGEEACEMLTEVDMETEDLEMEEEMDIDGEEMEEETDLEIETSSVGEGGDLLDEEVIQEEL